MTLDGAGRRACWTEATPDVALFETIGIKHLFQADSVAFAARDKAQELTGCVIGAIPPFSFNDQLQVLADPLIQQNEDVVFNAGRLDRSIFMKLEDYIRIAKPQMAGIALRG